MMNETDFDRLIHRMNCAYGCFLLWKQIRVSISIPDSGQREAERRSNIMNRYSGTFSAVLYALENTFITDLHKFFDKTKSSLNLETLMGKSSQQDQKEIKLLVKSVAKEIERIKTLRHNVTAHEPRNPQTENIFTQEVEKIFSITQQVINIMSKSYDKKFLVWDLWEENTKQSFSCLLDDLECGYKGRV